MSEGERDWHDPGTSDPAVLVAVADNDEADEIARVHGSEFLTPDSEADTMTEITIERTYATRAEHVWELWTIPEGIEQWWAPDGFEAKVQKLELEPGGELHHSLTATGPAQIQFLKSSGLPLATYARKLQ